MTAHTAGPWKYGGRFTGGIFSPSGKQVATIYQKPLPLQDDEEEAKANARLIAAAPNLLEACKAIDTFFVFFDSHIPPGLGGGARNALKLVKIAIAFAERTDG